MFSFFANPARFMAVSAPLAPAFGALAAVLIALGVWLGLQVPPDYQQGVTIEIMFVHVPAAITAMFAYGALGVSSFFGLIYRHSLADAAAKAAAPLGAVFAGLGLVTGSFWGKPEWGAWWVWDARLTSFLILFLVYLAYMAVHAAFDDEQRGARMAAILGLVGVVLLPIIYFSVDWWNSLHQGSTILGGGGKLAPAYRAPFWLMWGGYIALFSSLWLLRVRAEVWRRMALRSGAPRSATPGPPAPGPAAPNPAAQAAQVG